MWYGRLICMITIMASNVNKKLIFYEQLNVKGNSTYQCGVVD